MVELGSEMAELKSKIAELGSEMAKFLTMKKKNFDNDKKKCF